MVSDICSFYLPPPIGHMEMTLHKIVRHGWRNIVPVKEPDQPVSDPSKDMNACEAFFLLVVSLQLQ